MRYSLVLAIILACGVLSCYPTYNWRLVQTEQFGWEALFPAKPKRNSRKIIIEDHPKQTVMKIDRYSVALNQMDFILDVISFEGEMPDNVSSLQEYVNKMLKTNLNIPPEVDIIDGVLTEGFIGKGDARPVAMILKHLNDEFDTSLNALKKNAKSETQMINEIPLSTRFYPLIQMIEAAKSSNDKFILWKSLR